MEIWVVEVDERLWWGARFADGAHLLPSYGIDTRHKVVAATFTTLEAIAATQYGL
jgi:hypothetical protein